MRYVFMLMLMACPLLVAAERFEHTVTVSLQLPNPDFQVSTPLAIFPLRFPCATVFACCDDLFKTTYSKEFKNGNWYCQVVQ